MYVSLQVEGVTKSGGSQHI